MRELKNLNIWREEKKTQTSSLANAMADISDLNLSVRSYNCLKRAGCNTIADVFRMSEDEDSLKRVRNLGTKSAAEIREKLEAYKLENADAFATARSDSPKAVIKPAKKVWDTAVADYNISRDSILELHKHRIYKIKDLYDKSRNDEPGWFAVRELFEALPCRWRKSN